MLHKLELTNAEIAELATIGHDLAMLQIAYTSQLQDQIDDAIENLKASLEDEAITLKFLLELKSLSVLAIE